MHIQPSAKRNAIVGAYGDRLKIALASPALEGAANFALRRFLADRLKLPMSALHILRGETTRQKILAIATDLPIAELLIPPLN